MVVGSFTFLISRKAGNSAAKLTPMLVKKSSHVLLKLFKTLKVHVLNAFISKFGIVGMIMVVTVYMGSNLVVLDMNHLGLKTREPVC